VAKTHDLGQLLTALRPRHSPLRSLKRGADFLTRFALETRYPGDRASQRKAEAALRWADRVRTAARTILGKRPPRRKT
jgi:HEPN domain-containing protein